MFAATIDQNLRNNSLVSLAQRVKKCFCYLLRQTIFRAAICRHLEFGGLGRCLAFKEDLTCPCLGRDLDGLGIFLSPREGRLP